MKILTNKLTYIFVLFLLSFYLVSCGDDSPITQNNNPYQFDSARYNWTTDTLPFIYADEIFGFDSFHIYIIEMHSLTVFNGQNYSTYSVEDSYLRVADGLGPMNIYIAGSDLNGDYKFLKWDGITFSNIPAPSDTSQEIGFTSILVKSNNEIWLAAKGKIFFFNGTGFTIYEIDSTSQIRNLTEQNGRIYASGWRYLCPADCDIENFVYEFENGVWTRVYYGLVSPYQPPFHLVNVGKKLYANTDEEILDFNGFTFSKIISSPAPYFLSAIVDGKDANELLSIAFSNNEQFYINWNGEKWSKELNNNIGYVTDVEFIDNNYYVLSSPCSSCHYLFQIGSPK